MTYIRSRPGPLDDGITDLPPLVQIDMTEPVCEPGNSNVLGVAKAETFDF